MIVLVISLFVALCGYKAYKLFAVRHFEAVYTLDNKCKCVLYKDRIYKKYDKSTLERASKLD